MKRIIKRIFLYTAVFFLTGFIVWLGHLIGGGSDATILMYHSVAEPYEQNESLTVRLESFEEQMKFLNDHGYHVLSLEKLIDLRSAGEPIGPRTVVLTFDDGYKKNFTHVFPILQKYGFPATIFLVIDYLGQSKVYYDEQVDFLSVEEVRRMNDSRLVTFGVHTMSHPYLTDIDDEAELWREIFSSKKALEKITGKVADLFSYPSGKYNGRIQKLVRRAGYRAAVTTFPRKKAYDHSDLYALKRIKMTNETNPVVLFVKFSGYYQRIREMFR